MTQQRNDFDEAITQLLNGRFWLLNIGETGLHYSLPVYSHFYLAQQSLVYRNLLPNKL